MPDVIGDCCCGGDPSCHCGVPGTGTGTGTGTGVGAPGYYPVIVNVNNVNQKADQILDFKVNGTSIGTYNTGQGPSHCPPNSIQELDINSGPYEVFFAVPHALLIDGENTLSWETVDTNGTDTYCEFAVFCGEFMTVDEVPQWVIHCLLGGGSISDGWLISTDEEGYNCVWDTTDGEITFIWRP